MDYCAFDRNNPQFPYFCDWTNQYYYSLYDCNQNCFIRIADTPVHISQSEMHFLLALAGLLIGVLVVYAFLISTD